jgi:hypothetical protein
MLPASCALLKRLNTGVAKRGDFLRIRVWSGRRRERENCRKAKGGVVLLVVLKSSVAK